ncbi:acetoacetate decarboxylase family protein [Actinoplanes sp. LDG1-06]|uniref:Acetoacetate decarboxylase family protein n=1 Tax=Paractinoplanes ovalisporus TaxID=2810368 RepID=A0ABS2A9T7_9ACTN|nr:acetoacetate decarboxylase family protein [Actinoplanes ovalisporus]MBM2616590.1 acetoacetate decarboxylase family protein [Actinoplanes ovalisporus]
MAERAGDGVWTIQGETVTLPVEITSARLTSAVFTTPVASARAVLGGRPLRPFSLFGRAIGVLMCVHYDEWALKSYDEVGVGLLVRGPSGPPGLHFVDLPVTGAFTREAGQDFWALPKWLMDADLRFSPMETDVVVHDRSDEVMRASFRHGRFRLPFALRSALPAWSYLEHGAQAGVLLRGEVPMRLSGVRLGRGAFRVRLGDHPMAERMKALGMGARPLLTVHADRLHGPLAEFRPFHSAPAASRR